MSERHKRNHRPIISQIGVDEWHQCRRCRLTKRAAEFGPLSDRIQIVSKIYKRLSRSRAQVLHPYCWKCREQIKSEHAKHELYSPKLHSFIEKKMGHVNSGARTRGIPVFVDVDYLLGLYIHQRGKCALTGLQMMIESGKGTKNNMAVSVDRIDSRKGYVAGNVQLVCAIVNVMKNELPQHIFIKYCKSVVDFETAKQDELVAALTL